MILLKYKDKYIFMYEDPFIQWKTEILILENIYFPLGIESKYPLFWVLFAV